MATQQQIRRKPANSRGGLGPFSRYNRDQKLFITEAMLINSAIVITGGVFLTGLLLMMGASNLTVGLINSSGTWSMMLSLAASVIMERVRDKKKVIIGVVLASRLLASLPVFLPLVMGWGPHTALVAAIMMIIGNIVFSLYNSGFTIFLMESIPVEGRTPYIYNRLFFIRIGYTVFSLAMGFALDAMHKSYAGYIVVFSIGLVLGLADVLVLRRVGGTPPAEQLAPAPSLRQLVGQIVEPLKKGEFVRYLFFIFFFFLFLNTGSAYTGLYQLKYLKLSMAFLTVYNASTYVIMIAVTGMWARAEERIGRLKVLMLSSILVACEFFVYALLTTKTLPIIVLSPIFAGLGNSGFWASILPYRYDLMPEDNKTVYEGWHCFTFGLSALVGALVGGELQAVFHDIVLPGFTFSVFQINYAIAGALAMVAVAVFWGISKRKDCRCTR